MRIRAVTQNRQMSDCLGISTEKVDIITFGIGSGLAGVAGVAVSLLGSVGPNVGGNYIVGCSAGRSRKFIRNSTCFIWNRDND